MTDKEIADLKIECLKVAHQVSRNQDVEYLLVLAQQIFEYTIKISNN